MKTEIINDDNRSFEESDIDVFPPEDIVSYNEMRSCADIVRMLHSNDIDISPDFQRNFVWLLPAQTRFIDSLSKQMPIPSMCIGYDHKEEKRILIDGVQRVNTIINFLTQDEYRLSKLDDINPTISGKTVAEIKQNPLTSKIFTRIQNVTIPITILRCDLSKDSHNEYIFSIFHRLNTGGTKLNNQEIRNCIYQGPFNTKLKEWDTYANWRLITHRAESEDQVITKAEDNRYIDVEIILRFFAFYYNLNSYGGKLTKFLNDYMLRNKKMSSDDITKNEVLFYRTVDTIKTKLEPIIPQDVFSKKYKLEALLVGVGRNIETVNAASEHQLSKMITDFTSSPSFNVDVTSGGLYQEKKTTERIQYAINSFSLNDK